MSTWSCTTRRRQPASRTEQIEKEKQRFYEAQDPNEQQVYSDRIESLRGQFHDRPGLQTRAIQLLLKDLTVQNLSLKQLVETGTFAFGEEGFRRFLATPQKGRLIYSPKNFLGASLDAQQQEAFVGMIAKQLGYFRLFEQCVCRAVVLCDARQAATMRSTEQCVCRAVVLCDA